VGTSAATGITMGAYERLKQYLKMPDATGSVNHLMFQTVTVDHRVLERLGVDFRPVYYRPPAKNKGIWGPDDTFVTEWGFTVKRPEGGLYYDIIKSPLLEAEIEDLDRYPWPDPHDPGRIAGVAKEAKELFEQTDYAIFGPGMEGGFFELSWYLRGIERFFMDLIENKEFVHALFRKLLDYRKALLGRYLDAAGKYLDVVYYGDDIAMQTGPLMSLGLYRELVKPYQKELFSFIKEKTEAKLFYHTCGSVVKYLDDLIEIGVDIINPVQVSAKDMDTAMLKQNYGNRLVFWGGIDTQHVLPFGTEEEVEEEVKRRIKDLAPGGGYVLGPVHNVQPDVPPQNLVRVFQAASQYGVYPIRLS
jgi:uroporphyrinogen decarboxylase